MEYFLNFFICLQALLFVILPTPSSGLPIESLDVATLAGSVVERWQSGDIPKDEKDTPEKIAGVEYYKVNSPLDDILIRDLEEPIETLVADMQSWAFEAYKNQMGVPPTTEELAGYIDDVSRLLDQNYFVIDVKSFLIVYAAIFVMMAFCCLYSMGYRSGMAVSPGAYLRTERLAVMTKNCNQLPKYNV